MLPQNASALWPADAAVLLQEHIRRHDVACPHKNGLPADMPRRPSLASGLSRSTIVLNGKAPRDTVFRGAFGISFLVPEEGLEPSRHCCRRILSPLRLPIPPFRHSCFYIDFSARGQPSLRGRYDRKGKNGFPAAPSLPFCTEQARLSAKSGSDMNDTCQTTAHCGDSLFSDMEESGCQPSDVPLGRRKKAGNFIVFRRRSACGGSPIFPPSSPDTRAFPVPEPVFAGTCRCGMVFFPA